MILREGNAMDYSEKLLANCPKEEALLSYGFRQKGDLLVYERKATADPSFSFRVCLEKGSFTLDLIDSATLEA
jgi:hypothetical protein